ncbi:rho guanine nucleotide exchange factor 33 isoform X1 [Nothobranchius furzeri]|uniref:Rho guanine nucleotide exchange factor (GEF) 33 n=2 Tax=Nothobranchius furzeri TaxID=105023 RepID=A0A8C6L011_NOTFU|nr:transcript variant X1 [Nothobranchius furzeri]
MLWWGETERSEQKITFLRGEKHSGGADCSCLELDEDLRRTSTKQERKEQDYLKMEDDGTETETRTEDQAEGVKENVEEYFPETSQLQGFLVELRDGLHAALTELSELSLRDRDLEEKFHAHQTDTDDKIMGLKNSLNTFKEELNVALFHIKEVSSRQKEVQKRMEQLPFENKDIISAPHSSRKSSRTDVLTPSGDEHICALSQSELSVFPTLPHSESPQRSNTSTQTSTSDQEAQQLQKTPTWGEKPNSRDEMNVPNSQNENNKRQRAALELLESERVYVSHLSLLLKANISFNGSEAMTSKDKRPFPSSLRFLIQQHLELLHTLQERVLRCQWQGIMGDVFMRLTSKESDFLDFYVSYLKELPDCLSVVTMLSSNSIKSSAFAECDIMGDESKPSLRTLLLQPVQRIPEYLLLLQGLLRQTDADHPDYYLLLVCIQQFRSFTAQYHHLLQHNQELLLLNRKEFKNRSTMKQLLKTVESGIQTNDIGSPYPGSNAMLEHSNRVKHRKQCLLEQIQSNRLPDWDRYQDPGSHCYDTEWLPQLPLFTPDLDSRNPKPTGLGSIPESDISERSCPHNLPSRPAEFRQVQPGSALADALGEFLLPPDPPGMESLYEEDGDPHLFDRCSSASSDSSIDIAFVKYPKSPTHAVAANVPKTRDMFGNGGSQGHAYSKLPNRGCVSPDEAVMTRRNLHRPLQASQRKSKSLNGLQMENTVSSLDGGPLSDHIQRVGLGSHAKLERQGSKGSKSSTPSHKVQNPLGNTDKHSPDLHGLLSIDSGIQSWGDETKWKSGTEENQHTPFSERSRKDKGGFRSSFKKLFRKKTSDEKKEKGGEKSPESQNNAEHESVGKTPNLVHLEINRGTAV